MRQRNNKCNQLRGDMGRRTVAAVVEIATVKSIAANASCSPPRLTLSVAVAVTAMIVAMIVVATVAVPPAPAQTHGKHRQAHSNR
jgi:hypothetical protein